MAITSAICNTFKQELMGGIHNFSASSPDTFKCALIKATPTGTYNASTTNYSDVTGNSDETSGTGYTAGGVTLTIAANPTISGSTVYIDFGDAQWTTSSFSADGLIIYNSTDSNRAVCVIDFSGTKTVTSGTFTVQWPTADASNAILRIA